MSRNKCLIIILFVLFILVIEQVDNALTVRKFVYQKDLSEHCRRRVMPSVFLGRRVMDAHSQILHFSQLEVPYSCFISIRTESGSNIILVIQLATEENLSVSCDLNSNQLLVYELGETFGGYWGPLPDSVLQEMSISPKYYTLKTTTETIPESEDETSEVTTVKSSSTTETPVYIRGTTEPDYIRMDVPLVNVSGKFVQAIGADKVLDMEDMFDSIYDVTPNPKESYESTILPLVQFSIHRPMSGARGTDDTDSGPAAVAATDAEDGNEEPSEDEFQIKYDLGVSQDYRLPYFLRGAATKTKPYRYNVNRRLNFKKHKGQLFSANKGIPSFAEMKPFTNPFDVFTRPKVSTTYYSSKTTTHSTSTSTKTTNKGLLTESWQYIEDLMKMLNKKKGGFKDIEKTTKQDMNVSKLLQKISNEQHNFSVMKHSAYLEPLPVINNGISLQSEIFNVKASTNNYLTSPHTATQFFKSHSTDIIIQNIEIKPNISSSTSAKTLPADPSLPSPKAVLTSMQPENIPLREIKSLIKSNVSNKDDANMTKKELDADAFHFSVDDKRVSDLSPPSDTSTAISNRLEKSTLSLVGRESWENVVHAAPVMIDILNQTTTPLPDLLAGNFPNINMSESLQSKMRRKRYIQAVGINQAKPHMMTTLQDMITTSESYYRFSDVQDFAQLFEMQDDELYGRIALRYLGKYVGSTLFNICDYREQAVRHVLLLNSSRIVVAINKFTMSRMTLVATPARTLVNADTRCASDAIECQVSGARVCIDNLAACDGVPNCGTYDIYDEDRLKCNALKDLQHNVYLAAFTFMAVLLTLLYTVHYWLKRCVPKVSRAFFIYTDGSENMLNLETIMKSPAENIDDLSRLVHHSRIFDDVDLELDYKSRKKKSKGGRFKKFLRRCFRRKSLREHQESIEFETLNRTYAPKKMYSFTEVELSKMMGLDTFDMAVQTGESLEIEFCKELNKRETNPVEPLTYVRDAQDSSVHSLTKKSDFVFEEFSRHNSLDDELNLLKFFRDARTHSAQLAKKRKSKVDAAVGEETEIGSTEYNSPPLDFAFASSSSDLPMSTTEEINYEKSVSSGFAKKHLRFDEHLTAIPTAEAEDDDTETVAGTQDAPENVEEDQEHSVGRDFMRFWGGVKNKKAKKKPHQLPPR